VYKVGDAYFVNDGNHRVSVARQLGTDSISAFVTEVKTRVPLTAADNPQEIICKSRYADFLEKTNLDKTRPNADLMLTVCGRFPWFIDQIEAHRQQMGDAVSLAEAAVDWYDHIYMPVIRLMREQGIMRNFPKRCEADLYLLLQEHREELEQALGWEINTETAVVDLAEQETQRKRGVMSRVASAIVPPELEDGPAPGQWRRRQLAAGWGDRLFTDYLISLSGAETDWQMLQQVIVVAQWEHDRLLGLHVVAREADRDTPRVRAIGERFEARCCEAGLVGEFAVEVGDVADVIIKRAAWADLVVTSLTHPPGPQPLDRLSHGFNRLVQRCPRPIIAIPTGSDSAFDRVLLAYDGSKKADEALFVATYLKARWPISLTVLTVETEHTPSGTLDEARAYIEQYGLMDVTYVLRQKPIAEAVLETAAAYNCNEIIMGGFGYRPVKHLVLGSTVDYILREFRQPMLICR